MKHILSSCRHNYSRSRFVGVAPAFTLIEMLIVITLITVLLTIGAMGLKNMAKASGVSAGLPVAESIFSEARALAMGKGTKARVLIHAQNDSTDEFHRERFLRYMVISYEKLDDQGEPTGTWELASKGVNLPKGVYFSQTLSEKSGISIKKETGVELPGKSMTDCFYYEFNAEGMLSDPAPTDANVPSFVIMSGSLPPGSEEPKATGDGKKNIGGFVIWRTGRTSVFRHPDQIDPSL
jgi:prepilin-type N-terminal cleavage/methylation domain-containing protein